MTNVVVIGAAGRMGRAIARCILDGAVPGLRLSGAVEYAGSPALGQDAGSLAGCKPAGVTLTADLRAALAEADVAIDFSAPEATAEHAASVVSARVAWVIGTTGLSGDQCQNVTEAAATVPVVMAPNMSLGVNLLMLLVEQAARALAGRGYDIEIIERHHRRKKDSPSGTAIGLGEAAARGSNWTLSDVARHGRSGIVSGDRPTEEIGFHAVRGGDFVGDHTVVFAAEGESVELAHRATSRDTFAVGALQAAAWLNDKPAGLYTMVDVLGLQG